MAEQWECGKPFRLVRKILRKHGIHPWSLLVDLNGESWTRMIQILDAPRWLVDASQMSWTDAGGSGYVEGFRFFNVGEGFELPEGLVTPKLEIRNAPDLRRLPRRLWAQQIRLIDCPSLEALPERSAYPESLHIKRCPKIGRIPDVMIPHYSLVLEDCEALRQVRLSPRVSWDGGKISVKGGECYRVRLKSMRHLKEFSGPVSVMHLWIWNCPSIGRMKQVTVMSSLDIHGCGALETLPTCNRRIGRISVSDCPSLTDFEPPPLKDSIHYDPMDGPSQLPALAPIPRIQEILASPLLEIPVHPVDDAWPWPPVPAETPSVDPRTQLTMQLLGMHLYDQLYALVALGQEMRALVHEQLRAVGNPGRAVELAISLMVLAAERGDQLLPGLLLLEAEALGLGGLSPALNLCLADLKAIGQGIHSTWPKAFDRLVSPAAFLDAVEVMEGPLVLHRPVLDFSELRNVRKIHGPLWSDHRIKFRDCPKLEVLPALMVVQDNLDIRDCESLRQFPKRLQVKGNLKVRNLPRLRAQTCVVQIGGDIWVEDVPGLSLIRVDSL